MRLTESKLREIHWPSYDFYYGSGMGVEKDFVLGIGAEPQLRWRTFTETMLRFVRECHVEMIVTLGAYLDDVLYTRPVPLTGYSTDPKLMEQLDLMPSRYQGPTGIIGVLADASRKAAVPHASMWASLPHYLAVSPNPRGTLALLLRLTQWLGLRVDTSPLERAAAISKPRSTKRSTPTPNSPPSYANSRNANSNSETLRPGPRLQRGAHPGRGRAPRLRLSRFPRK